MLRTLLALLAAPLATVAHAQPINNDWSTPAVPPLVVTLLPAVDSEGLTKELKLTADQTKRLVAFRQKQWDATYTTPTKDLKTADQNKAAEAELAAVLSADQLKRAKQIATQNAWNNNSSFNGFGVPVTTNTHVVPLATLRDYPELGDALKLDEAQKQVFKSEGGFRYGQVLYLTPPQSDAAKELLGPPFTGALTYQYDERMGGRFGGFGPPIYAMPALQMTTSPDVQKELNLSAEQIAALDELRKKYPTTWGPGGGRPSGRAANADLSPEDRQKADEKTRAEVLSATDKILTAEQRTRLDQLPRHGIATRTLFLTGNDYGKELGVTAEQRKAFTDAQAAHDAASAKVVLSDEPLDQVKAKVQELNKRNDAAVEAILTPAQQAKRKELAGAEFKGRLAGTGVGGFGGPGTFPTVLNTRELTFGRYTTQLSQLASLPGLQAELKLTEEQVNKVREASQAALTQFRRVSPLNADEEAFKKSYAERSAFVEKSLADILTKDQQARLREVFLQQLDVRVTSPFASSFGAVGYPGVAEAVKLTADQKKKLLAGERSADVLTDDQKKAIQGMLGKSADIPTLLANPRMTRTSPFPTLPPTYAVLPDTTVWGDLKLTPEQISKLVPALNEYTVQSSRPLANWGGSGPGGGPGGATAVDQTKAKAVIDALVAAADATLTAGQKKRLGQLALQQRAASSLAGVLGVRGLGTTPIQELQKNVQTELGVTNEQMMKINTQWADAMERATLIGGNNPFTEFATLSDTRRKLRDQLDDRILKELTPAQVAKWKEMLGEPYKGFTKNVIPTSFRGGVGGPGGGVAGPFGP